MTAFAQLIAGALAVVALIILGWKVSQGEKESESKLIKAIFVLAFAAFMIAEIPQGKAGGGLIAKSFGLVMSLLDAFAKALTT